MGPMLDSACPGLSRLSFANYAPWAHWQRPNHTASVMGDLGRGPVRVGPSSASQRTAIPEFKPASQPRMEAVVSR
jgi:hypothetical protein